MSPRLPRITGTEVIKALHRAGWYFHSQTGSHVYLKHPNHPGRVTVAVHAGEIIKPKTLQTILKQSGLTIAEFIEFL